MHIQNRLETLRKVLSKHNLDGCIIPSTDPHASEYVAEHWKARAYFSGFTGSAGTLVVTKTKAGLWTDSRYFLQAEKELTNTGITLFKSGNIDVPNIEEWITQVLDKGNKIGIYKDYFSISELKSFSSNFTYNEIGVVSDIDFIGEAWKNRPSLPLSPIFIHNEKFSGESYTGKLNKVKQSMQNKSASMLLLNCLDEIAWLLNIRGNDIPYNPVTISYVSIEKENSILFIDSQKVPVETKTYFSNNKIIIRPYTDFESYLLSKRNEQIWIDKNKMNYGVYEILSRENDFIFEDSPILHLKCCKNTTEIQGTRNAMLKDGVALTKFLIWFENCWNANAKLDEISVAKNLLKFRAEQESFFGESFAPIIGHNEHSAIVHYSATNGSNKTIDSNGFLLVDSGGQYFDGTTDITRTFSIGKINSKQKQDYTLVLKGHIALAKACFPTGTCGYQLDALARQFLWNEGLNYGHGTGHGVGSFLCVHEGPQGIRPDTNRTPLKEGMILSNEPGMYRTNEYGIRIENLILVQKCKKTDFGEYFCFETLTLFPFDSNAINIDLLNDDEICWINNYHQTVSEKLSPLLENTERSWLVKKCQPLKK